MTTDPRFNSPGPNGPGAGTGSPDPATEQTNGTAEATDEELTGDQPGLPGDVAPDAGGDSVDVEALQVKAAKADEYLSLAQRTQADFENFRKRSARDASAATQRGAMKLAKELLPAVDNLERALEHAPEASDDAEQAFVAGIRHVHSDLIGALQRAGIERYSPEGEPFDPTLHEAVAQQPFDGFEPGTVVEVFQRGYRIGENVVRPARVVVAG
jgi:molecular chaperone GrpE